MADSIQILSKQIQMETTYISGIIQKENIPGKTQFDTVCTSLPNLYKIIASVNAKTYRLHFVTTSILICKVHRFVCRYLFLLDLGLNHS